MQATDINAWQSSLLLVLRTEMVLHKLCAQHAQDTPLDSSCLEGALLVVTFLIRPVVKCCPKNYLFL